MQKRRQKRIKDLKKEKEKTIELIAQLNVSNPKQKSNNCDFLVIEMKIIK